VSGIAPMVWHNYDPETGTGDPSTPLTADKLNQWTSDIVAVSDAAEGYAADAAQSALDAVAPTDAQVADLIVTASATRAALEDITIGRGDRGTLALHTVPGSVFGTAGSGNVGIPGRFRTLIGATGLSQAFPALALCDDGTLLAIWRQAPAHSVDITGQLFLSRSTDLGDTWSTPVLILDDATVDQRDPYLRRLATGRLALTYFKSVGAAITSAIRYSDDNGATWSAEVALPFTFTAWAAASGVVELADGTLVAFGYGKETAGTYTSTRSLRSTDGGATWTGEAVMGVHASRDYNEVNVTVVGGTLVALIRSDDGDGGGTDPGIYRTTSVDGGVTWAAPTLVIAGWGRPGLVRLSSGALVATYRSFGAGFARHHMVVTSWDNGVTWSAASFLHYDALVMQSVYVQLVEVARGLVGIVYADEYSTTNGLIRFKYLVDGVGFTPLGDQRLTTGTPPTLSSPASTATNPASGTSSTVGLMGHVTARLFADTVSAQAVFPIGTIPSDWSTFDVVVHWAGVAAGTENVRFDVALHWLNTGVSAGGSGTYVSGVGQAAAGANLTVRSTITSGVARQSGPLVARLFRIGADALDTYAGQVAVFAVEAVKAS
jgi:hypothetical protein